MADSSGWWASKLGHAPQQPNMRQQPVAYPPQGYPQAPPGYPPAPQQGYPPQGYPQQQQIDTSQIQVTPENLAELTKLWQGGEATKTETTPCPKCGSPHYFSRSNRVSRLPAPAPTCYTCGYNGLFEQADAATWQAGG